MMRSYFKLHPSFIQSLMCAIYKQRHDDATFDRRSKQALVELHVAELVTAARGSGLQRLLFLDCHCDELLRRRRAGAAVSDRVQIPHDTEDSSDTTPPY